MGYRVTSIDAARSAVLVIDMQNDFVAEGAPLEFPDGRRIVPAVQRVLNACRQRGMPVIYTAHVHRREGTDLGLHAELYPPVGAGDALVDGEPGGDIYPELAPQPGELVIKKHRYSAFYGTELDVVLRGMEVDTLLLMGMTTECCVLSTARGALELGYRTLVAADACASCDYADHGYGAMPAAEMHAAALRIMALTSSDVADVDDCLGRLGADLLVAS
jgi:ureidoacrylate peracid hydrolase